MRTAELAFLLILVLYHLFLLVPRYRRPFASNYLVFAAGMALAWNLGMEGFRWQEVPLMALLFVDMGVLFPTFKTLRGRKPRKGFFPAVARGARTLTASAAFLVALVGAVLPMAFPLPEVDLSGGLRPGLRLVHFAPEEGNPGLELHIWYPASGDQRPLPRPQAEPAYWVRLRDGGGLPTFWQAYEANLPTNLIYGGKLASSGTRYPVIYLALPPGQSPEDFGYLWEDLASRGYLVAAATGLPGPQAFQENFNWDRAWYEWEEPFVTPGVWLEPERTLSKTMAPTEYRSLALAQKALGQLDNMPGDLFFSSVDWKHQGLWSWGPGPGIPSSLAGDLGIRCQIHAGGQPGPAAEVQSELWIVPKMPDRKPSVHQWFLEVPGVSRADLADSAYLKPYLAFFGLKTQVDSGFHGLVRQYQAAFLQFNFWGSAGSATFGQTVPVAPGVRLSGQ